MSNSGNGNGASNARLVADAWKNSNALNTKGQYSTTVRGVQVRIGHIEYGSNETSDWVDVWLGKKRGSPAFRITNPQILVADPRGDVTIEDGSGRSIRFREDPVHAVAEAIVEVRSGK